MPNYIVTFQPNNRITELDGSDQIRSAAAGNFFSNHPDEFHYSGLNPPIFRNKNEAEEGSVIINPNTTISNLANRDDITKDETDEDNIKLTIYTSEPGLLSRARGGKMVKKHTKKKYTRKKKQIKKNTKKKHKKKHTKKKRKLSTRASKSTRASSRIR